MSKNSNNALVKIGKSVVNLDFCSFRIETETTDLTDPYDLAKTVRAKINNLVIYDMASLTSFPVRLVNPDDPTVKLIAGYLKDRGITLNVYGGRFEYMDDTIMS